ncbi:MAG TPA: hypothetical protein VN033_10305 [Vulgatibacter sp.]|nr:hypothetical protein [Vulgatibacter sp.]
MALSEVAICNVALARIGVSAPISSLDEASAEATNCKTLYAPARDTVLAAAPWPFATRRALLAEVAAPSDPPYADTSTGWAHRYALPVDCLVAREVWSGQRNPLERVPFAVEFGGLGRVLLTDQADAQLIYTAKVVDPASFDPGFDDALAWHLAADLALPLKAEVKLGQNARAMAEHTLLRATARAFNEGQRDRRPSAYLAARR